MKIKISCMALIITIVMSVCGYATESTLQEESIRIDAPHILSAQSAIVVEKDSKRILFDKDSDLKLPMASTTKIMTALIAIENGDLDQNIQISGTASGIEGSSMYLKPGEIMTLEELVYGLMLVSGNDAAVAIAEYFGGIDAFVKLMNDKAIEIGAVDTHFTNPNGLPDDNHYSTAYDMALIAIRCMSNPKFAEIVACPKKEIAGYGKEVVRELVNHNKLLRMYGGCIGIKTGFTKAAGRCLVSAVNKNDMTLICVTLNAKDDWKDHMFLYDNAYAKYSIKNFAPKDTFAGYVDVKRAPVDAMSIYVGEDIIYPIAEGEQCEVEFSIADSIEAPIENDCISGTAKLIFDGNVVKEVKLITKEEAPELSFMNKFKYFFRNNLKKIYSKWITIMS